MRVTQRLFKINVGAPSATLAQHHHTIGSTAVYVYQAHLTFSLPYMTEISVVIRQ